MGIGIFAIVLGLLVTITGLTSKNFHWGGMGSRSGPEIPVWVGRLLIVGAGLYCMYRGWLLLKS
jgi:hypothetical protein